MANLDTTIAIPFDIVSPSIRCFIPGKAISKKKTIFQDGVPAGYPLFLIMFGLPLSAPG
jgi:hypothetical protein